MEKSELITQTKLAFDFIQKLYFEVSYLIKEIEGLLAEEEEKFVFGRTSGYAVAARSSNALDSFSVNYWMYKKLAVFFIPAASTHLVKGQTVTHFEDHPKILYVRIILADKDLAQPIIYFGVLKDFVKKGKTWPEKIEHLIGSIEYNESKVFNGEDDIHFEDANVIFNGKLSHIHLYDINTGEEVAKKLVAPALRLFRES
jgi:hypothetical protein